MFWKHYGFIYWTIHKLIHILFIERFWKPSFFDKHLLICIISGSPSSSDSSPSRCSFDNGYIRAPPPSYDEANNVCQNAVVSVSFDLIWKENQIEEFDVTVILADVPIVQTFEVILNFNRMLNSFHDWYMLWRHSYCYFFHDSPITGSIEEIFLQDFLEIRKRKLQNF